MLITACTAGLISSFTDLRVSQSLTSNVAVQRSHLIWIKTVWCCEVQWRKAGSCREKQLNFLLHTLSDQKQDDGKTSNEATGTHVCITMADASKLQPPSYHISVIRHPGYYCFCWLSFLLLTTMRWLIDAGISMCSLSVLLLAVETSPETHKQL